VDKVIFDDLKPSLNYFPIKVGKAEMLFRQTDLGHKTFQLCYDGLQWCTLNVESPFNYNELKDGVIDVNLVSGKVVTTGLGFGLIQTELCKRANITEVVVYEKYQDIIEMFLIFAKASKFDLSKLRIVNKDAKECVKEECDWLCMDHFELVHQTLWEIIDQVRYLSKKSKAKNVMFWPIHVAYLDFCVKKKLKFNPDSYAYFSNLLNIKKLPKHIDQAILDKFNYFVELREKRSLLLSQIHVEQAKNNK